MIAVVPTHVFTFLPLSLRCHLSVTPLDYKKEAHVHVEGVRVDSFETTAYTRSQARTNTNTKQQ